MGTAIALIEIKYALRVGFVGSVLRKWVFLCMMGCLGDTLTASNKCKAVFVAQFLMFL